MNSRTPSLNHQNTVYSEVFEIEFTEDSINLYPLSPTSLKKLLNINPILTVLREMTKQSVPGIKISYESITGYRADPGLPVFGKPVITLLYLQDGIPKQEVITFQAYTIIPSSSYNRLQTLLNLYRIADQSKEINIYARFSSWLIVPVFLVLGFYMFNYFNGVIGIFGGIFFLYGIMMIFVTIAEIIWRRVQFFRIK